MRTMWALVDAVKIHDVAAISMGASRWHHHLHFLFVHFLAYEASSLGKSGDLGIEKGIFTYTRKIVFLFTIPLTLW